MTTVGLIGLGAMGSGMASSLRRAGHTVQVFDVRRDEALFARLPHTVGVANLLRFGATLRHWPAWLAASERGQGFAEVAVALLAQRRAAAA